MTRVFGDEKEQKEMRCPKCGGATVVSTVGSITQWLSACSCNVLDSLPSEQSSTIIHLCATCGKRISAGRSGSLTQWVFRLDLCSCTNPKPIDVPSSALAGNATAAALAEFDAAQASGGMAQSDLPGSATGAITSSMRAALPGFISGQLSAMETGSESGLENDRLLAPDADKFPIERYNVLAMIGQGSSGTVYFCQDLLLNKMVAVKALHTLNSAQLVAFQREAKATSRLNHPNVIQVNDFGVTAGGVPYMCMEFVNGMSLERYLSEGKRLSVDDTLNLFHRICQGLAHAHAHGILHRDIKSSNILLGDVGNGELEAKVIDFGVAVFRASRMLGTGANGASSGAGGTGSGAGEVSTPPVPIEPQDESMAGSPNYMPPDQSMGFEYDERSEVYGLGCTIFEVLTGQVPFPGSTTYATMRMHAELAPPKLSDINPDGEFSQELEELVAKCLRKAQSERFQSVTELGEALLKARSDAGAQAKLAAIEEEELFLPPPVISSPPTEKEKRASFRSGLYIAGSIFLFVAASVMFFARGLDKAQKEAPPPNVVQKDLKVTEMTSMLDKLIEPHFDKGKSNRPDWYCAKGNITDKDLKQLRDLPGVTKVSVLGDRITGKGLKYIQDLPLVGLDMTNTLLSDEAMVYVSKFVTLEQLDMDRTPVTDKGLEHLAPLRNLENLSIGPNITDKGLDVVSRLDKLHSLSLDSCSKITAGGISKLAKMKDLQDLTLNDLQAPTNLTVAVARLPVLDCLSLEGMKLDARSLDNVSKLSKLKKLELNRCTLDAGLERLAVLHLKLLQLRNLNLSEKAWKAVSMMKNLKRLEVRNCDMRDENVPYISGLTGLTGLNLGVEKVLGNGSQSNRLTDNGISSLKSLVNLRDLEMAGVAITDSGIPFLLGMKKLESLELSGPGVTDKGLRFLPKLEMLREITLFGCPNISEGGVNWLRNKLPNCHVTLSVGEHSGEGLEKQGAH